MAELTAAEKKWVKQGNAWLAKCPSKRIGFYTIGDPYIGLYDCSIVDTKVMDAEAGDLIPVLNKHDANFTECLDFPRAVDGVCG